MYNVCFFSAEPLSALHGGALPQTTIKVAAPPMYLIQEAIAFLEAAVDAGGLVGSLPCIKPCHAFCLRAQEALWKGASFIVTVTVGCGAGKKIAQEAAGTRPRSRFLLQLTS